MWIRSGWTFVMILLLCGRFVAAETPEKLLKDTEKALEKRESWLGEKYKNVTYSLSSKNQLDVGWLLQTPNYWGQSAKEIPFFPYDASGSNNDPRLGLPHCTKDQECTASKPLARCVALKALESSGKKVCIGHSDAILDTIFLDLIQAEKTIDVLSLQREDERFRGVLTLAAEHLAKSGKSVTIRYLLGVPPQIGAASREGLLLDHLVQEIPNEPGSKVTMFQAEMLYRMNPNYKEPLQKWLEKIGMKDLAKLLELGSWNHAKIIAVDGRTAIVGGHNLWTYDYLTTSYPVHDLSMRLRGPAAQDAHKLASRLWTFVCNNPETLATSRKAHLGAGESPQPGCQPKVDLLPPIQAGHTPVLAVGNLGLWNVLAYFNDAAQASVYARSFLMDRATTSIKISQQEIATRVPPEDPKGTIVYPTFFMRSLGAALVRNVDVYIVLGGDAEGQYSGYSHGIPIKDVGEAIRKEVQKQPNAPTGKARTELLCKRLHLANLRFSKDKRWIGPDNESWVRNHAKMWMIDDHVFYIGADNVYPAALQEFGYIVGGKDETSVVLDQYWNPLWTYSKETAVSGSHQSSCMFKTLEAEAVEQRRPGDRLDARPARINRSSIVPPTPPDNPTASPAH